MSGTTTARIADFCVTGSGGTPSRDKRARYYDGGTIPWVKSGELRERVIHASEEHITEAALAETSIKLVPAGALLLAMYGATVGRLGILGVAATTNQAVCHIIPDASIADTRYLFHALQAETARTIAKGVGGAQPNISQAIVKDISIRLPPLPEQRRIAAILDKADALRAKRRAALAELDDLGQSVFLEMFGDLAMPQQAKLRLGDAVEHITVGHVGPTSQHFTERASGVPFLRTGNIGKHEIVRSDLKYITKDFHRKLRKSTLKRDDILVSRVISDEVRCAVVPPELEGANCANAIVVRPGDRLTAQFLAYLIRQPDSQSALLGRRVGSAQSVVNTKVLQEWTIAIPPIEAQRSFARRMAAVDSLRSQQRSALADIDCLFVSLQHRAFRGEL